MGDLTPSSGPAHSVGVKINKNVPLFIPRYLHTNKMFIQYIVSCQQVLADSTQRPFNTNIQNIPLKREEKFWDGKIIEVIQGYFTLDLETCVAKSGCSV